MPEEATLDNAIENTEVTEETSSDKVESKDSKDDSAPSKDGKSKDEVKDDIDVVQAKNLYKALSDPATARPIIEALAKQAGLLDEKPVTKEEKKEAKKAIQDVFKEALGEDLGFLADKLGPAIEQVLKHYDAENNAKFAAIEESKAREETSRAVESLYSKYEDATKYEARIAELMDEFSPGRNSKPGDYIEKLYKLAKAEANDSSAKEKLAAKLKNNSEDATARLSSSSARETSRSNSKVLDLDGAIEAAAAALESKHKE